MKCAVHTELDASGFCRNCGKSLCEQCKRDVRGILYCEECLATLVAKPQPVAGAGNPTLAAVLGFVPGLGAVYNAEYIKAIVHVLVLGALFALADQYGGPVFVLAIIGFWVYMPIEAYRTARAKMLGQKPTEALSVLGAQQPVGAYLLIALGALLLLNNLLPTLRIWDFVGRLWPIVFIALGVWLLWKRTQRTS